MAFLVRVRRIDEQRLAVVGFEEERDVDDGYPELGRDPSFRKAKAGRTSEFGDYVSPRREKASMPAICPTAT
jgi:hypothetical protein